jgi:hypothetical protein
MMIHKHHHHPHECVLGIMARVRNFHKHMLIDSGRRVRITYLFLESLSHTVNDAVYIQIKALTFQLRIGFGACLNSAGERDFAGMVM